MKDYNINIQDVIEFDGELWWVVGVVHDDKKVYLSKTNSQRDEIEVDFKNIENHWVGANRQT